MLIKTAIIQKLKSGKYRLYSKKKDSSGKRRNLGTYDSLEGAKKREREVQYFKQNADDGNADDKESKALSKLSDIAGFLEDAGFIDASDKVYMAMNAIDGSLCEDNVVDLTALRPDNQVNVGGPQGGYDGGANNNNGLLSMQEAEKLANVANILDKKDMYEEADAIDDILNIINKLENKEKHKKKQKVNKKDKKKQKEESAARSNGRVGTGVTDNQNAGMFQGFSDAYFYSGYGNLEGAYGPSDR